MVVTKPSRRSWRSPRTGTLPVRAVRVTGRPLSGCCAAVAFAPPWRKLRAMKAYPHRRALVPCLMLFLVPLATGCVRVEEYDSAIYQLQNARAEAARNGAAAAAANAEVAR